MALGKAGSYVRGKGRGEERKPIKIVYFNPTGTLGGAELCLLDVLHGVKANRPEWTLKVLLADDGPVRLAVEKLGIACDVLPIPSKLAEAGDSNASGKLVNLLKLAAASPSAASYFLKLRRWLKAENPDILQTNGMKAHLLGAWGAPRNLPVVWQMHDYPGSRPLMAKLLKASRRPRLKVAAVSKSVADDTRKLLGPDVPVTCVYNAIDLERFSPGVENGQDRGAWLDQAARLPPAPSETVRIGLVATYARWKGHEVFLEAAAKVAPNPSVRFYIVGGPIYRSTGSQFTREELETKAERLGLQGRIGFVPHQSEPETVFRSLDVVVHASTKPEPFGRVIVEGMACGRAVVAVKQGGAAELFRDGISAIGCPPEDPTTLCAQLNRLIASRSFRYKLGLAAREDATVYFDRNRLGNDWCGVYETFW